MTDADDGRQMMAPDDGRQMMDDSAARAAIATDLSSTLFVDAGAGSGKTTQLVARILEILLTGRAGVDQLAAITFTEAAAGELRDRLAERLELAAAADPTASRRAAAVDALAGLDGAAVTTLHGFARRILADHPFAAGLPAVFEVLDEVRSAIAFDDRWAGTVDTLLADPGRIVGGAVASRLRRPARRPPGHRPGVRRQLGPDPARRRRGAGCARSDRSGRGPGSAAAGAGACSALRRSGRPAPPSPRRPRPDGRAVGGQ